VHVYRDQGDDDLSLDGLQLATDHRNQVLDLLLARVPVVLEGESVACRLVVDCLDAAIAPEDLADGGDDLARPFAYECLAVDGRVLVLRCLHVSGE
jgi:hypothetical protein